MRFNVNLVQLDTFYGFTSSFTPKSPSLSRPIRTLSAHSLSMHSGGLKFGSGAQSPAGFGKGFGRFLSEDGFKDGGVRQAPHLNQPERSGADLSASTPSSIV
jgi:hypothetical protein